MSIVSQRLWVYSGVREFGKLNYCTVTCKIKATIELNSANICHLKDDNCYFMPHYQRQTHILYAKLWFEYYIST